MIRLMITKTDAAAEPPILPVQAPRDQRMGRAPHAEPAKGVPAATGNGQAQCLGHDSKSHPYSSEEKLA